MNVTPKEIISAVNCLMELRQVGAITDPEYMTIRKRIHDIDRDSNVTSQYEERTLRRTPSPGQ